MRGPCLDKDYPGMNKGLFPFERGKLSISVYVSYEKECRVLVSLIYGRIGARRHCVAIGCYATRVASNNRPHKNSGGRIKID